MMRTHAPVQGVYAQPPSRPDWLHDRSVPVPDSFDVSGPVGRQWEVLPDGDRTTDHAVLDAFAKAIASRPWDLPFLASGMVRRDVAIATTVRVVEQTRHSRCADFVDSTAIAVLRRLDASDDEVVAVIGGLTDPPSLPLLAWVQRAMAP